MEANFDFTPRLIAQENIEIVKTRELPLKGQILVKEGEYVSNNTVIGKTMLSGDLILIRVANELCVDANDINKCFLVNINDKVNVGDVIVHKKGFLGMFNIEYKSKYTGVVEFISKETGSIGIRLPSKDYNLLSYVSGKIVKCDNEQSVKIRTIASMIQGVFGLGGEKVGVLNEISNNLDDLKNIQTLEGQVVFCNTSPSIEFLNNIRKLGATGIILPSISSSVLKKFLGYDVGVAITGDEDINETLIITEGFGNISFNPNILDILNKNIGRNVSLNGTTQIRAGAVRPEIIIFNEFKDIENQLNVSNDTSLKFENGLKIGSKVKILREPFFGMVGTITQMFDKEMTFESGVVCRAVEVSLSIASDTDKLVLVPKTNVEVI